VRVVQCDVFEQVRGGQRPGAASLLAVQRRRVVVRLFRGDAGSAAHDGARDGRWSDTASRCAVDARAAARRARPRAALRGASHQRPRLHHLVRHPAAHEAVRPPQVSRLPSITFPWM